ncbi:MAG: NHL repeat-containing protein [Alphaproteobacteria bacterium]|nr:NHL repeat-containing protein [Alphaproteobacteria bacterium]
MVQQIRSSSFQALKAPGTETAGQPLLAVAGPFAILGWSADDFAGSISPSAHSLFGPRGVCLHPNGSLWVSDTGHHRVLGWHSSPSKDNAPADILIGQVDFTKEGRNGKAAPGPASLNVPTGICAWGDGLAVADAWNHRIRIWRTTPSASNQPADIILGQSGSGGVLANRGDDRPTAATLNWPYGVAEIDGRLLVADTGNRRVLIWNDPQATGQPADLVLGHATFENRDENAGGDVGAVGMRWPHGIAEWNGKLAISDAGNNRVMIWPSMPETNGAPCETVLGQSNDAACDHNGASYYPASTTVNMPYAISAFGESKNKERLIVADTANSRLIGFSPSANETGAGAEFLSGQPDFASKGDNRWGLPERDTMCWPYGLSVRDNVVAIADSGNNRVLLWEVAR